MKSKKKKRSKIDWDRFWEEYCNDPNSYDDIFCVDPPRFRHDVEY